MSRTTSRTAGKLDRALQQVEANIADAHVQKAVTKVIEHHSSDGGYGRLVRQSTSASGSSFSPVRCS